MGRILGVADIGSNTAHLMIGECDGKSIRRLTSQSEWISLGEVVALRGFVPPDRAAYLVSAMAEFLSLCRSYRAESLYVFATEAIRAAENGGALLDSIHQKTGLRIETISSHREAELSYRGAGLDVPKHKSAILIEVGGGSVQVARFDKGQMQQQISLPLGTGKLIAEAALPPDPTAGCAERAEEHILDVLSLMPPFKSAELVIASGGVARGLWKALHPDGDTQITTPELDYMVYASSRLNSAQIASRFGIKGKRSRTMLPGALVYRALLQSLSSPDMIVSAFGIREGAMLELFEGCVKGRKP